MGGVYQVKMGTLSGLENTITPIHPGKEL